MDEEPPPMRKSCLLALMLLLFLTKTAMADSPCYYYGTTGDGHEGRPTAFASWYGIPGWLPLEVRPDWPGVAVQGYAPGTVVRLTVTGLPDWAGEELRDVLVGRSAVAVVADRPGGDYVDCWPLTFRRLTGRRMWVGKVYVTVREVRVNNGE